MATAYYTPGVYIEEVDKGPKPIQGVGTSVTAFVGFTQRAVEVNEDGFTTRSILSQPKLITNLTQYERCFGGLHEDAYLPYSIRGFFDNGGVTAWVISVHSFEAHPAQALVYAPNPKDKTKLGPPCLLIHAREGGPAGDKISVVLKEQNAAPAAPEAQSLGSRPRRRGSEGESTTSSGEGTGAGGSEGSTPTPEPTSTPAATPASTASATTPGTFTLTVLVDGREVESIPDLTLDRLPAWSDRDREADDAHRSRQVKVWSLMGKSGKPAERVPTYSTHTLTGGTPRIDPELLDAADRNALANIGGGKVDEAEIITRNAIRLFEGSAPKRKSIGALEAIDNVNLLCAPDLMMAHQRGVVSDEGLIGIQQAMLTFCQKTQYRFAILDAPHNKKNPEDILNWRMNIAGFDSMHAALYYPWVKIADPLTGRSKLLPPCGHVAGIYARSDNQRGVHKAPANEVVAGAIDLEINVTRGEQDLLNPVGINCIRKFSGRGIRVWGARTLSSDPAWRYINVRRLFNYAEESIERSTQWTVFEPNDVYLWSKVRRDITAFLRTLWRQGALFGNEPATAFYVKCDEELNPQEIRDQGIMLCEIGMAPVKPAEFVVFRFSQYALPSA